MAGFSKLQIRAVLMAAFVVTVCVAAAAGPACADPLQDANAAVARSDFATALPLYRALAEKETSPRKSSLATCTRLAPASNAIGSRRRNGTAKPPTPAMMAQRLRSAISGAIGRA